MRVRPSATSSKRTCPEVSTSLSFVLFQAMPRSGLISVVRASNSTVLPRGPLTLQWLVSPATRTSSTLRMIRGKFSRFDQYVKTSCSGAWTSMLSCTRWAIALLSLVCATLLVWRYVPEQRCYLNPVRSGGSVQNPPNGPENGVIQDRQEHLRVLLLPRRQVDPGERQPAGPSRSPGQNPQGRSHARLFHHPATFPAQKTQSRPGSDTVSEVRNRCQHPPGLGREVVQHPEFL